MSSHVQELNLRLTIGEPDRHRVPALRELVERRFVPGVLEAMERSVHRRFGPECVLRVRRLAVVDERDRLVGILALDDVLARRIEPDSPLARALRSNL